MTLGFLGKDSLLKLSPTYSFFFNYFNYAIYANV